MAEAQTTATDGGSKSNQNVLNEETIVNHGGDSITSFEELESVTLSESEQKDKEDGESNEEETLKAGEKEDEEDSRDELLGKESDSETDDVNELETSAVDKAAGKIRKLKVVNGDDSVELRADSVFTTKVNGKPEKVTAQELLNNYSGKQNWDIKYQELSADRKTFETQRNNLTNAVNEIHKRVTIDKDPRSAIEFIAESLGQDPLELWKSTVAKIETSAEDNSILSLDERRIRDLEEEAEYRTKREQRRVTKEQEAQSEAEVLDEVNSVLTKYDMKESEFVEAYNRMATDGSHDDVKITPAQVGKFRSGERITDRVTSIVDEMIPESDSREDAIEAISRMLVVNEDLDFTDRDIKETVLETYGDEAAKRLSRKITKNELKREQRVMDPNKDPTFFGDFDDE